MSNAFPRVLVVDDDVRLGRAVEEGLKARGQGCLVVNGAIRARQLMHRHTFDVLVTDVSMPVATGLELLDDALELNPDCRVILITGIRSARCLARALEAGAYDFLHKPFEVSELARVVKAALDGGIAPALSLRAAKALEQKQVTGQAGLEAVGALVKAVEAKDPCTCRHSEHVAHYAVALADLLGLGSSETERIRTAAMLHDAGKIGIPDRILTKPGRLDDSEFGRIRRHPAIGAEILENIAMFSQEAGLIRYHHERWDGTGYSEGLRGEQIPLGARIIAIADAIDAMLMRRSYKAPFTVEQTVAQLEQGSGTQFDPNLAAVAARWVRENPDQVILHADQAA
ncbi:MAG: HD domain-containing phosphohydrolase [Phycisphaerae bacterium]